MDVQISPDFMVEGGQNDLDVVRLSSADSGGGALAGQRSSFSIESILRRHTGDRSLPTANPYAAQNGNGGGDIDIGSLYLYLIP